MQLDHQIASTGSFQHPRRRGTRAGLRCRARRQRAVYARRAGVPGRGRRCAARLSGGCSGRFARQSEASRARDLLDHVLFDWLDRDAGAAQPGQRAFDLIGTAFELDRDQAHFLGHAGAANIENEVELLHQLIKDRLLDQRARIAQVVAFVDAFHLGYLFFHLAITCCRRSGRHSCHPIHKFVERYLSPKSQNTVTIVPSRIERATFSAAIIAAPDDCPTRMPSVCPSAYTISYASSVPTWILSSSSFS